MLSKDFAVLYLFGGLEKNQALLLYFKEVRSLYQILIYKEGLTTTTTDSSTFKKFEYSGKSAAIVGFEILFPKYQNRMCAILQGKSVIFAGKICDEARLALEMLDCISLLFYESYKAVLSVYCKTEYLKWGGLIGIFVRIPFVFITFNLGFGLWAFGIANTLDFAAKVHL